MPTIPITNYEAGETMVAADANNDFTTIQSSTAILDDDNTRTEWCSRSHLDQSPTPIINDSFSAMEDFDTTMVVTTNVFSVVALAPNFRITYGGLAFLPGEVLRMHFDINVVAAAIVSSNATDILTNINSDCYQFRFFFRDSVTGVTAPIGSTSTYSTTTKSDHIPSGAGGNPTTVNRIGQRVNHSYCWINTTGATINIDWIEIRVRLCEVPFLTSVSLKEGTFQTFRARH
jgi:hypothetical protein